MSDPGAMMAGKRKWEDQVERLFALALEVEPDRRESFLAERCGAQPQLLREVLELLDHDRRTSGFLQSPALEEQARAAVRGPRVLSPGDRFHGREVVGLLGAGGMGSVYTVWNPSSQESEALKILPPYFLDQDRQIRRFRREAKTLAGLAHPGIVEVREIGEEEGFPFLAMELVKGETLESILAAGPLPVERVVDYAIQIAEALRAAHRKGVIHRDIKASNVIVTPEGRVKILDFGLAKFRRSQDAEVLGLSSDSLTLTGTVLGTVHSMSPEQARGEKVDRRTDLFSLGVLIYQMSTGRPPFSGATVPETIHHICSSRPHPIARYSIEASERLESIVQRCLQKNPEDRYPGAEALLRDLRNESEVRPLRPVWLLAAGLLAALLALLFFLI